MSKLHQPHGRADADTTKGELRKADDYSDQPGQGTAEQGENHHIANHDEAAPAREPDGIGTSEREYGHSSGDRNTRRGERDWPGFRGGIQRNAPPDPRREPGQPPQRRR